jgi:hypothetical protein
LKNDIAVLTDKCFNCITELADMSRKHTVFSNPLPKRPKEYYSLDLAQGYEATLEGYTGFLIAIDMNSLFLYVWPTKTKSAEEVTRILRHSLFPLGMPKLIRTDRDRCFVSDHFQKVLTTNGIEHQATPRGWPQSNGLAESFVRRTKEMIRLYIRTHATTEWVDAIETYANSHNCSPLSFSTPDLIITPERLMFGLSTTADLDLLTFEQLPEDPEQWYRIISANAKKLQAAMLKSRTDSRVQRLTSLNRSRRKRKFNVGDIVFARTKAISTASSAQAKLEGPFMIHEVLTAAAFIGWLSDPDNLIKVHFSHMVPAVQVPGTQTFHPLVSEELKELLGAVPDNA